MDEVKEGGGKGKPTDENERKGRELMAEADKRMGPSKRFLSTIIRGITPSSLRGASITEEACELYLKAGNCFKMAKKWSEAGDAFSRAAATYLQTGSRYEAATQFVTAATCYRKTDVVEAISCYTKANEIYIDLGHISMAAGHQVSMAELFEHDPVNSEMAIFHYQKAADFYEAENSTCSMNKCLLKVASYSGLDGKYEKAAELYEQVAKSNMASANQRHSGRENLLRAGLCILCSDAQDASNAIARYEQSYHVFVDSRECVFLKTMVAASLEQNSDKFADAVRDYGSVLSLDPWYSLIIAGIEKGVDGDANLR